MKVIRNDKNTVKFSQLKPGDTFIDPNENCVCGPEMKIEYEDVYYHFSEIGETLDGFASISLETGNVFFYDNDFYVIPIKLNAVED